MIFLHKKQMINIFLSVLSVSPIVSYCIAALVLRGGFEVVFVLSGVDDGLAAQLVDHLAQLVHSYSYR